MHWDTDDHDAMTDTEQHQELVRAAEHNARQDVAQAALLQDVAGRQLSVLRNTYPAWDIDRERDATGNVWWTARLRPDLTPAMAAAGVLQTARRVDAIALASTLAWQSALLHHGGRSRTGPI
ncbi:hypothetical protein [Nonomuraea turcica]|uniref:hypothetical protein n=1 Tax=Nonomuraea sp. G32 TaxID=3067274 RepID=UPI00273B7B13|nr:hypothetical protein [Nonomuraea sp. G32]MDP4511923.1 hypothetical protein [Nonomuraea sp. G32]